MSVRPHSAVRGNSERLAVRRRKQRQRARIAGVIFATLLLSVAIYGLWRPSVRISHIIVKGSDAPLSDIASKAMEGSYLGIIPRNSIFFFPAGTIRADILAAYPDVEAISIVRDSLSSISLNISKRVPLAMWCGASPDLFTGNGCYFFDPKGFVYATATTSDVTNIVTEKPLTPFILFMPLPDAQEVPIGTTLQHADDFPAIFDFARQIGISGASVRSIVLRDDEVDFYVATTGTRITFLLGDEQNAFTSLMSAKDTLAVSDPSLEYIDLRFPGKIYLKKREVK